MAIKIFWLHVLLALMASISMYVCAPNRGLTVPWRVTREDDEDDEDLWDRQEDRLYFILFQVKLKVFTIIVSLICRDETIFNKIRLLEISNLK